MRKIITSLILVFLLAIPGRPQSYEGTVSYQKKDEKAIVAEFPYAPSVVEDAIVDKFDKMGFKKKESKGFLVYKNIVLTDISSEPADYMIKVERKSRKERDESIVYLIVSRNDENIIARSDALLNSNAKTFMDRLSPDVDAYSVEVQIKDQEANLSKAERKLRDLQDDQNSMEKKIKKLQDDVKDNIKDQENQQKEIDKQKQVLDALKQKRKT